MQVDLVRPGRDGLDWLLGSVSGLKSADPLQPVTVVVPNYVLGRFISRHVGRAHGSVNLHAVRLADLAVSILGGPSEIPAVLTPSLELGAARAAVDTAGRGLRPLAHHHSLYQELLKLFRELRRQDVHFTTLSNLSDAAKAAAATFDAFRALTAPYADSNDIRRSATQLLLTHATPSTLREVGPVIVYLPTRLDPIDADFLNALQRWVPVSVALPFFGDHALNGDDETRRTLQLLHIDQSIGNTQFALSANVQVLRAPDPAEEIREIVRAITANLEHGVPLHRQAILYRQTDPYAVLVRESLDGAGLKWSALDGQPLSETAPGRALLAAVRIGQSDFAREAVLAWLTVLPERLLAHGAHGSEWDRLTREANVVRGATQWQHRLDLYATEIERDADQREQDGSVAWAAALRLRANRARAIAQTVLSLADALEAPPDGSSWSEFVDWAESLRTQFASAGGSWTAPHDRGSDLIREVLTELCEADRFPTTRPLTLPDFVTTLEAALTARSVPEGRLGVGVVVGPVQSVTGFAFDRVYLVGLVEGAFPPSSSTDAFFPDEAHDPLQRVARSRSADRRSFLAALSAADGGEVTLGVPESTGGRAAFPSRWLLEWAGKLVGGAPLDAMRFRRLSEHAHPWLRIVHSTLDGLARASAAPDIAECRMQQAATWRRSGRFLSTHPLGLRPDLPIAAGLRLAQKKRSNQFTEFDGNLAGLTAATRLRRFFDGTRPLSPTTLELWATCPYRFFLESVLRVAPTHDPEEQWTIDAAEKGSLVHEVLERFFSRLALESRPKADEAYTQTDLNLLERVANERLQETEQGGDAGHPLVWEATRRELLADLRTFLERDTQWRRSTGMDPTYFEKAFGDGHDWGAVALPVQGGTVRVRGRMDRVDLSSDRRRAFVFDYKTGSASRYRPLTPDPIDAGKKLQLAVYARAVSQSLGGSVRTGAAYWFISSRGEFRRIELLDDPMAVDRRLDEGITSIARGIATGVFPAVPGSDDYLEDRQSNCQWCPYDTLCPAGRDQDWQRKQGDGCESFISLSALTSPEPGQ